MSFSCRIHISVYDQKSKVNFYKVCFAAIPWAHQIILRKKEKSGERKKRKLQTVSFSAHRIFKLGERAILLFPAFPEVLDICSTGFLRRSGFPVVPAAKVVV
jgi:hypothetical protein